MTPLERKSELVRRGITVVQLATQLGVDPSMVSHVIAGTRRSRRVEKAVAKAIGQPIGEVFEPPFVRKRKKVA